MANARTFARVCGAVCLRVGKETSSFQYWQAYIDATVLLILSIKTGFLLLDAMALQAFIRNNTEKNRYFQLFISSRLQYTPHSTAGFFRFSHVTTQTMESSSTQ